MSLIIYKSSAGSGKTYTLVKEYLKKVLKYPTAYRTILAITFTNKATEEMKMRIIHELDILSTYAKSEYRDELIKFLEISSDELIQRANDTIKNILHDFSSFSISTIDSYFQTLSRTLARELNIPIKFNLELDIHYVSNEIALELLKDAGKDDKTTFWLKSILEYKLDNGKNWNILPELVEACKKILTNKFAALYAQQGNSEEIHSYIQMLLKIKNEFEESMREMGDEGKRLIAERNYDIDAFSYKATGAISYLYKISKSNCKDYAPSARTKNGYSDVNTLVAKAQQKDTILMELATQYLHPLLIQSIDYFNEHQTNYITAKESLKLIHQVGINIQLNKKLKAYRDKNEIYTISDTTRLLQEAINEDDAAFIYEKSGNTYKHIFIDEFQDTSDDQWKILRPLLINTLATNNDVFLVGDAKQSIYRWRGGNQNLILTGAKKDLYAFKDSFQDFSLGTNYRSFQKIVNFNNLFFYKVIETLRSSEFFNESLFDKAFTEEEVRQKVREDYIYKGFVEFIFFETDKKEDSKKEDKADLESEDVKWKQKALKQLNEDIERALKNGFNLKDIAILVRTNDHESEIANHLLEEGKYAFVSSNSILLSTNEKVIAILNCFELLQNKEQPLLIYEILKATGNKVEIESATTPYSSYKILNNEHILTPLFKESAELKSMPIDLAFYRIRQILNFEASDPYIDKFSDLILNFAAKKGPGIKEFLVWWSDVIKSKEWSVDLPEETNAIRILTTHKSKGLQFPIVFIPFLDWSVKPRPFSTIWGSTEQAPFSDLQPIPLYTVNDLTKSFYYEDYYHEGQQLLLENINLLYVAFTRAESELHVYGNKNAKGDNISDITIQTIVANELLTIHEDDLVLRLSAGEARKNEKVVHQKKVSLYNPLSTSISNLNLLPDKTGFTLVHKFNSEEIVFGNLVHLSLSYIYNVSDINAITHKMIAEEYEGNNPTIQNKLKDTLESVWKIFEEKNWTNKDWKIKNEPDLTDSDGILHRPDRLLINDNKVVVLDFKTGAEDAAYHDQVKLYGELLTKMGYTIEGLFLIYTNSLKLVEVDFAA